MNIVLTAALFVVSDIFMLLAVIEVCRLFCRYELVSGKGKLAALITLNAVISVAACLLMNTSLEIPPFIRTAVILINQGRFYILAGIALRKRTLKLVYIVTFLIFANELLVASVKSLVLSATGADALPSLSEWIQLAVRAAIYLFVFIALKKNKLSFLPEAMGTIPKIVFLLILLNIAFMGSLEVIINIDALPEREGLKLTLIRTQMLILVVTALLVIYMLLTTTIAKKYQSDITKILEKQVDSQLAHYEQLEKVNKDMRAFRHDYINHLICINNMLETGQTDDVKRYIAGITAAVPVSAGSFDTGNLIADAVLSEKARLAEKYDIRLTFRGIVTTGMENTDICTILANALDNAIEACVRIPEGEDRRITVIASVTQGYFILDIENTTGENVKLTEGAIPETTKSDKGSHGFGLYNIKKVAAKYDGTVKLTSGRNTFRVGITIPEKEKDEQKSEPVKTN